MTPEEIHRELDKLWSKVTSAAPPAAPAAPLPPGPEAYSLHDAPAITREVTLETLGLVKKQHRAELTRLTQLADLKERSLSETLERLRQVSGELDRLRRRDERSEELATQQALSYAAELEAAQKGQAAAQERLAEEEARLRAAAEEARRRMASEEARWRALEADWNAREQDYLARLHELEARAQKEGEKAAAALGAERRSFSDLEEAKKAVEASLAELLNERREREEAEKERGRALARVKDVEERMNELQNLWTEERKQWQELWERERSAWEAKKQEMAAWEERVRQDKEAFHAKFGEIESRETRYAEQMTEVLRRSSDAGERIGDFMRQAAAKAAEVARLSPPPPEAPKRRLDWRLAAAAAAALAVAAAAVPVWRSLHKLTFTLLKSYELKAERPTAIAFDGDSLWVAEWGGTLATFTPTGELLRRVPVAAKPPYHPAAVSIWAGKVYTLDVGQGRIVRSPVEDPTKVEAAWPTPGSAPAALAHDGQNLWSYDAATKVLYRHLGEGPESQTEAYKIDADVVPTSMRWQKGELWVWDAKGKQVVVLRKRGAEFELDQAAPLAAGVQSLLLTTRADEAGKTQRLELWALAAEPSGELALKKYTVGR